jgi:hypothetical protein
MTKARELAELGAVYDSGALSNRNLIINGEFLVSQRGDYTSATAVTNDDYYVDRWKVRLTGVTANIEHIKGSNGSPNYPNTGSNTLKLTATSTASGVLRHLQQVEGFLKGRELTFSAWVKSNSSDARLFQFQHGTTDRVASTAHSGNGEWEKLTVTATNNATADNQLYFDAAIASSSFGSVSITSGDYIEIAEAQLEFGPEATPFEYRSFGDEKQRCLRYYASNIRWGWWYDASDSNTKYVYWTTPVEMRATPSVTNQSNVVGSRDAGTTVVAQDRFGGYAYNANYSVGQKFLVDAEL